MRTTKGQSAVETMITVAVALAFILPMVILFLSSTSIRTQSLAITQAQGVAQQIADTAGEVWYAGNGSRKTLLVHYPDRLLNISLGGDTLLQSCPPAHGMAGTAQQMQNASREVVLTLDNSPAGATQVAALTPAMVCNAYTSRGNPAQNLSYSPGRFGGGVTGGLVMLIFENEGSYVNITRQYFRNY
ncbi:MAG: hypothetical protein KGH63_01395 [Candidatus Micrarchaeota archaeon]|nr:hypothetical protein [Candidatus Micrarchaeota archaeon]